MSVRPVSAFFLVLTLILFLCFPVAAFDGAKSGLLLWFHQVLPSLLPFLVLTRLLIALQLHRVIGKFLFPVLHPLFGCSSSGCFAFLGGLISGLPLGAKLISELYESEEISQHEGRLLLCLASNPSPMFLISFAAISELKLTEQPYLILLLVLLSTLPCHAVLRFFRHNSLSIVSKSSIPIDNDHRNNLPKQKGKEEIFSFALVDDCIMNGFETIAKIGGYIILFNMYASIWSAIALPLFSSKNPFLTLLPLCLTEMTTGIHASCTALLGSAPASALLLSVFCAAFSGLSGLAQVKSVLSSQLLPFHRYVLMKFIQGAAAMLLTVVYLALQWKMTMP